MPGRAHRISVRLAEPEAKALRELSSRLGCTTSQAVRLCLVSARPVLVSAGDEEALRECSRTIGRMGGLLNQVAHRLNERRDLVPDAETLDRLLRLVTSVSGDLSAARADLVAIRERQGARVEEAMRQ